MEGKEQPSSPQDLYIKFFAGVDDFSAAYLMQIIDQAITSGIKTLHLLLSTPGGSVFHGLSIYNYLRGAPIKVITHNFGQVDSIGVILFCAGSERLSVPNARFLLHGVAANFPQGARMEELQLDEVVSTVKTDSANIARVIASAGKKDERSIRKAMHDRTTLTPQEAEQWGLVTRIEPSLFPTGAKVIPIQPMIGQQPGRNAGGSGQLLVPPTITPPMPQPPKVTGGPSLSVEEENHSPVPRF